MYNSVEEYFEKEHPFLVDELNIGDAFWLTVKDNTISNDELDRKIAIGLIGGGYSGVFQASIALMRARMTKKLPNPD